MLHVIQRHRSWYATKIISVCFV